MEDGSLFEDYFLRYPKITQCCFGWNSRGTFPVPVVDNVVEVSTSFLSFCSISASDSVNSVSRETCDHLKPWWWETVLTVCFCCLPVTRARSIISIENPNLDYRKLGMSDVSRETTLALFLNTSARQDCFGSGGCLVNWLFRIHWFTGNVAVKGNGVIPFSRCFTWNELLTADRMDSR